MYLKTILTITLVMLFAIAATAKKHDEKKAPAVAASPTPTPAPKYDMTDVQRLRLENMKLRVELAQESLAPVQREAQLIQANIKEAAQNFLNQCDTIKAENHWPDEVKCDFSTLTFAAPK